MQKAWQKKERSDSKTFGGKRTARSGGFWNFPADVKSPLFLIDSKTTTKKSFSIPLKMWEKISREAILEQRIPMLSIRYGNGTEVVVLSKIDFLTLTPAYDRPMG